MRVGCPTTLLTRYGVAVGLILAADGARRLLLPDGYPALWILPYVLAVAIGSWVAGFGPGFIVTAGATWLVSDALERPTHWLGFTGVGEALGLVLFVGLCLLIDLVCAGDRSSDPSF